MQLPDKGKQAGQYLDSEDLRIRAKNSPRHQHPPVPGPDGYHGARQDQENPLPGLKSDEVLPRNSLPEKSRQQEDEEVLRPAPDPDHALPRVLRED